MVSSSASNSIVGPDREGFSKCESAAVAVLAVAVSLFRLLCIFRYPFDSDEPQHLHIVWGWTRGLMQYRDVFDNHTPLFHLLLSPLQAWVGERPDALYIMRFAMLPLYGFCVWCTYAIGKEIHSKRVGLWAAVFTALFPAFFFPSLEFRTDNLWTLFFLLAILNLIKGQVTAPRGFLTGVLLGAAFCVSQKTVLLLGALSLACPGSVFINALEFRVPVPVPRLLLVALAASTGFLLIPGLLAGFYYWNGALPDMIYGVFGHNIVPCAEQREISPWWTSLFLACMVPLWIGARRIARSTPESRIAARRTFLFLTTGIYLAVLQCFWPYLTVQNYLPACPLLMLVLAPFAIRPETTRRDSPPGKRSSLSGLPLLLCLASFEVVMSILVATPWQDGTRAQVALLEDVLRLTDAKDHILDLKGETLFRKRSFFYVMEAVTIARMQCGAIVDDIRERLLETQTCVVVPDDELFPPDTRKLLLEHYLPVGNLRVAGRFLTSDESIAPRHLFFEVLIAARYDIVAPVGAVSGLLDGVAYKGPVFLEQGRHEFVAYTDGALALVWARAIDRGFSPFTGSAGNDRKTDSRE